MTEWVEVVKVYEDEISGAKSREKDQLTITCKDAFLKKFDAVIAWMFHASSLLKEFVSFLDMDDKGIGVVAVKNALGEPEQHRSYDDENDWGDGRVE